MDTIWTLVAIAATGVTSDWQPLDDKSGGVEYVVQVEPKVLESAEADTQQVLECNISEHVGPIRRIRIVLGGDKSASELVASKGRVEHSVLKPVSEPFVWPKRVTHTVNQSGTFSNPTYSNQAFNNLQQNANATAGQLEQGFQQARQGLQNGFQQADQALNSVQNGFVAQPTAEPRRTISSELLRGVNELRDGTRNVIGNTGEAIQGTAENVRDGLRSVVTGNAQTPAPAAAGSGQFVPFSYKGAPAQPNPLQPNPPQPTPGFTQPPAGYAQPTPNNGFVATQPSTSVTPVAGSQFDPNRLAQPAAAATTQPLYQQATPGFVANPTPSSPSPSNPALAVPLIAGNQFQTPPAQSSTPAFPSPNAPSPIAPSPDATSPYPPRNNGYDPNFVSAPSANPVQPSLAQQPTLNPGYTQSQGPFVSMNDPRNRTVDQFAAGQAATNQFTPASGGNGQLTSDGMVQVRQTTAGTNGNQQFTNQQVYAQAIPQPSTTATSPGVSTPGVNSQGQFTQWAGQQQGNLAQATNQQPVAQPTSPIAPPTQQAGNGRIPQSLAPIDRDRLTTNAGIGPNGLGSGGDQQRQSSTPVGWIVVASLVSCGSLACNFFLGASYLDARHKYQSALRRTVRSFSRSEAS